MWDAIEELEPTIEPDTFHGNLLLVFLDDASESDMDLRELLEKKFARAPGGRDLRFAFALKSVHAAHHSKFHMSELPAAVFVREGIEIDRSADDDLMEMVKEVIRRYS